MYIAFKWLLGLTLTMWVAACSLSLAVRNNNKTGSLEFPVTKYDGNYDFNISRNNNYLNSYKYTKLKNKVRKYKVINTTCLFYPMILAAAIVIAAARQKSKVFALSKNLLGKEMKQHLKNLANGLKCWYYLNVTTFPSVATRECIGMARKFWQSFCLKSSREFNNSWIYIILIKRLEEIVEEKNKLSQLLLISIQENKNLKTQNHLEILTKNKLTKFIEDSQKDLNYYKVRLACLQNLHLVSRKENICLKDRLDKLTKKDVDRNNNLLILVRKIYNSRNEELINFCNNLIFNKGSLHNIALRNEFKILFEDYNTPSPETNETNNSLSTRFMTTALLKTKIIRKSEDKIVPFVCLKPRFKGRHKEYLWTVKNSDGLIERIYEYDNYESDYDNGDVIRRIREYSVFCDKDCVLDGKRAILNDSSNYRRFKAVDQKFLTGSEAFQTFLRNNKSLVGTTSPPQSPRRSTYLICG